MVDPGRLLAPSDLDDLAVADVGTIVAGEHPVEEFLAPATRGRVALLVAVRVLDEVRPFGKRLAGPLARVTVGAAPRGHRPVVAVEQLLGRVDGDTHVGGGGAVGVDDDAADSAAGVHPLVETALVVVTDVDRRRGVGEAWLATEPDGDEAAAIGAVLEEQRVGPGRSAELVVSLGVGGGERESGQRAVDHVLDGHADVVEWSVVLVHHPAGQTRTGPHDDVVEGVLVVRRHVDVLRRRAVGRTGEPRLAVPGGHGAVGESERSPARGHVRFEPALLVGRRDVEEGVVACSGVGDTDTVDGDPVAVEDCSVHAARRYQGDLDPDLLAGLDVHRRGGRSRGGGGMVGGHEPTDAPAIGRLHEVVAGRKRVEHEGTLSVGRNGFGLRAVDRDADVRDRGATVVGHAAEDHRGLGRRRCRLPLGLSARRCADHDESGGEEPDHVERCQSGPPGGTGTQVEVGGVEVSNSLPGDIAFLSGQRTHLDEGVTRCGRDPEELDPDSMRGPVGGGARARRRLRHVLDDSLEPYLVDGARDSRYREHDLEPVSDGRGDRQVDAEAVGREVVRAAVRAVHLGRERGRDSVGRSALLTREEHLEHVDDRDEGRDRDRHDRDAGGVVEGSQQVREPERQGTQDDAGVEHHGGGGDERELSGDAHGA